jgi:hypothetical protein
VKIELTEEQAHAARQGQPVEVVDPQTQRAYLVILREAYERDRHGVGPPLPPDAREEATGVPPGIRRSQEAFWRDLPELLKSKKNRGKWVCYHGDERIGIARTQAELIRECLRRGLHDDEYDLDVIEPHALAPWEVEEIEPGGHIVDEESPACPGDPREPA